jgi:hypothetical protein
MQNRVIIVKSIVASSMHIPEYHALVYRKSLNPAGFRGPSHICILTVVA